MIDLRPYPTPATEPTPRRHRADARRTTMRPRDAVVTRGRGQRSGDAAGRDSGDTAVPAGAGHRIHTLPATDRRAAEWSNYTTPPTGACWSRYRTSRSGAEICRIWSVHISSSERRPARDAPPESGEGRAPSGRSGYRLSPPDTAADQLTVTTRTGTAKTRTKSASQRHRARRARQCLLSGLTCHCGRKRSAPGTEGKTERDDS